MSLLDSQARAQRRLEESVELCPRNVHTVGTVLVALITPGTSSYHSHHTAHVIHHPGH